MNNRRAVAAAIAALLPISGIAIGQDAPATGDQNSELRREVEEQKQRLAVLERKLELQQEATATAAASAPRVTINASRFQVGSNRQFELHSVPRHAARR